VVVAANAVVSQSIKHAGELDLALDPQQWVGENPVMAASARFE
jgi:hypothetical protein